MITGKINLAKLEHILREFPSKSGEKIECIVMPIKKNHLFKSDKGNVFLDLAAFDIAPEKRKGDDTHLVVQSFNKETRDKMKADGVQSPILGNLRADGGAPSDEPNTSEDFTAETGKDDLPF